MRNAGICTRVRPESPAGVVVRCAGLQDQVKDQVKRVGQCGGRADGPAADAAVPRPAEAGAGHRGLRPQIAPKPTLRAVCSPIST